MRAETNGLAYVNNIRPISRHPYILPTFRTGALIVVNFYR
jgi:hypothetical protein